MTGRKNTKFVADKCTPTSELDKTVRFPLLLRYNGLKFGWLRVRIAGSDTARYVRGPAPQNGPQRHRVTTVPPAGALLRKCEKVRSVVGPTRVAVT